LGNRGRNDIITPSTEVIPVDLSSRIFIEGGSFNFRRSGRSFSNDLYSDMVIEDDSGAANKIVVPQY